jgi:hypothetical protein
VGRFHRPDPTPQPVHQRKVVRVATEQGLAQVDVGLDESRKDIAAARVEDSIGWPMAGQGGDAPVAIDTSPRRSRGGRSS